MTDLDGGICQNNRCAEAQRVVGLLIADSGSTSCLFVKKRVRCVSVLFPPGVISVYNQPMPVVPGKQQAGAWRFESPGSDI